MNYCSIQDAWGNTNYITEQYKKYDQPHKQVEHFDSVSDSENNKINYTPNERPKFFKENFEGTPSSSKPINHTIYREREFNCDDFFNHISKCSRCRMRMRRNISSKILERMHNFVYYNKDNLLLFLIILFSLIFLNLLLSSFRKN
jgi:hypothetical protein